MADGRNDHVTVFILHLSLAIFSFSKKISNFALASKAILKELKGFSHLCTYFFKKTKTQIREARVYRLPFAVNAILNL